MKQIYVIELTEEEAKRFESDELFKHEVLKEAEELSEGWNYFPLVVSLPLNVIGHYGVVVTGRERCIDFIPGEPDKE